MTLGNLSQSPSEVKRENEEEKSEDLDSRFDEDAMSYGRFEVKSNLNEICSNPYNIQMIDKTQQDTLKDQFDEVCQRNRHTESSASNLALKLIKPLLNSAEAIGICQGMLLAYEGSSQINLMPQIPHIIIDDIS